MKYTKKIKKHFEYISSKDYFADCAGDKSTLKCACAVLEGLCHHFFTGEKPLDEVLRVKRMVLPLIEDVIIVNDANDANFYSAVLTALCLYQSNTGLTDAQQKIEAIANPLLAYVFEASATLDQCNQLTPAKTLTALNAIAEYYFLKRDQDVNVVFNAIFNNVQKIDFYKSQDNCFDYLTYCSGMLKLAKALNKSAVSEHIALLFDNFMVNAQSLNYCSAISFINKKESSGLATARSLEVALLLYDNLQDPRYLTLAKRIWFNGLQFCQRENGQVGSNTFSTEQDPILKVIKYEIKQITTPLYSIALKCFATNREFFEEHGNLFKDRRGRYFVGDKMFARDESGFFGSDLIEIPTLTAFDSQTAMQLRLKLTFK